jgi:hypothetical protein
MLSNEPAVKLHVCHPSCHVTEYSHSVSSIPWCVCALVTTARKVHTFRISEAFFVYWRWQNMLKLVMGVLHYCIWATASYFDYPYHRWSINLYLRTNLCTIQNSNNIMVNLMSCKIIFTRTYQYETGFVLIKKHS